jgi:CheY-like chemotaxis protein
LETGLVKWGYDVVSAKDGKEALKVYRENNTIDLVILDMIMPEMGGGETYDKMKDINPDVKVLLSSGYSIDGQAKEILARGCDGFIQKPLRTNELSEKVWEILCKRQPSYGHLKHFS